MRNNLWLRYLILFIKISSPQYIYAQPNQVDVVKGVFIPWCDNCTQGAVKQVSAIIFLLCVCVCVKHAASAK